MAKKRLDPTLRFSDVVEVWKAALSEGGVMIETDSDSASISLVYRLNQYRKVVREDEFKGWTDMDRFIVRRGELCVQIEPRLSIDLLSRAKRLDGSPIPVRPKAQPSVLDETAAQYAESGPRFVEGPDDEDPEYKKLREEVYANLAKRTNPRDR